MNDSGRILQGAAAVIEAVVSQKGVLDEEIDMFAWQNEYPNIFYFLFQHSIVYE